MLAEMVKIDLKNLRSAGCAPTDEQIINLNDLGLKIERGRETTVVNAPRVCTVGNVTLYEPTYAALEWWHNFGRDASWTTRGKLNTYYFMLAHARDVEILENLDNQRKIRCAVRSWVRRVGATDGELWRALLWVRHAEIDEDFQDQKIDPISDDEAIDKLYRSLIASSAAIGVSPDDLKTQTMTSLVALLIEANNRAKIPTQSSVAKLYIAYQSLIREIEAGKQSNG